MEQELNFSRRDMVSLPITLLLYLAVVLPGQVSSLSGTYLLRYLQGIIRGRYSGLSKSERGAEFKRVSKVNMINSNKLGLSWAKLSATFLQQN